MVNHKPRALLLGANGMLGWQLQQAFSDYHLTSWTRADLDITNQTQVLEKITALKPAIIINTAAYTAVDQCESNRAIAFLVNAEAPKYLALAAKQINAVLVHYSTDYVFNGTKAAGYLENDTEINPVSVYGESKAAGEQAIQKILKNYYIIRTAWLYGEHGMNFVDTMLRLAKEKPELKVVHDQHGSPTYTKDLAEQTRYILEQPMPYGIYHVTNSGVCTWYEFAKTIFIVANTKIKVTPCTTAEFPRPAKRPEYSVLLNTKLPPLRSWQKAAQDYLLHNLQS
ncbi:MAG: dTDP-4-dehydrorhamnose reductase [Patescibacteria group bacterium]|jgi:dTDP-4-dehydrorhamnose reductase